MGDRRRPATYTYDSIETRPSVALIPYVLIRIDFRTQIIFETAVSEFYQRISPHPRTAQFHTGIIVRFQCTALIRTIMIPLLRRCYRQEFLHAIYTGTVHHLPERDLLCALYICTQQSAAPEVVYSRPPAATKLKFTPLFSTISSFYTTHSSSTTSILI